MEFLVVLGLGAAVLITSTIFGTNQTISRQELDRARDLTRSEISRAQADAYLGRDDFSWGVAFFPHQIIRFRGTNFSSRNPAFDFITNFSTSLTLSGASEINFTSPEGAPTSPINLTLTDGTRSNLISVNAAGAISVQ